VGNDLPLKGINELTLSKVIDRLATDNQFSLLRLSSPFLAGYSFHDEHEFIVRMMNW